MEFNFNLGLSRSVENTSGFEGEEGSSFKSDFVGNSIENPRETLRSDKISSWDDLYTKLRYDKKIDPEQRVELWERHPIAQTIVERPPKDTWRKPPKILNENDEEIDPPFIKKNELIKTSRKADRLQRLHGLAIIIIGTRNEFLEEPPTNNPTYLEVYSVKDLSSEGWEVEKDRSSENYGEPVKWFIEEEEETLEIHGNRVLPVAELTLEHDLDSYSALDPNFNALTNISKVLGGNSEAHYQRGLSPLYFNFENELRESDELALNHEMKKFRTGLTDYIALADAEVSELSGDPSSIKENIELNLGFISAHTNIPKRILIGSERGELASTQDEANYYGYIDHRRSLIAEEMILRPYLNFLEKNYGFEGFSRIEWPSLFELNEVEKSKILMNKASALKNLISAINNLNPGKDSHLVYSEEEIRNLLGDPDDIRNWLTLPNQK